MVPRPAGRFVGITGTPGTGKKSIAPLVASRLGLPSFSINDFATARGLLDPHQIEAEVDVEALKRVLTKSPLEPALVYGHLLPYAFERRWVKKAVVLRCDPLVLRERLRARGYRPQKILENVEAELIGVISTDTVKAFGSEKVVEFDTSSSRPGPASASISAIVSGSLRPPRPIDWLEAYGSVSKLRSLLS